MKLFCVFMFSLFLFLSCDSGSNDDNKFQSDSDVVNLNDESAVNDESAANDADIPSYTDNETTDTEASDEDLISGYIPNDPGTQQYAAVFADTGRTGDFSVTDPKGNGEEIVTDSATALIWQKNVPANGLEWQSAVDYCENLNYGGYSDWYLPTIHELMSIADYGKYPASGDSYFGDIPAFEFWTSYNHPEYSGHRIIDFEDGMDSLRDNSELFAVRCVLRKNVPEFTGTRFTTLGEGYFSDALTGKEWYFTKDTPRGYADADNYCATLSAGGKDAWRVPGLNELRSVVNYRKYNPSSDFSDILDDYYWSSISKINDDYYRWYIYFSDGGISWYVPSIGGYVACIHD